MAFEYVLTKTLTAADDDGIAQSQSPGSAGNLTLNGVFVTAGVAQLDTGRRVAIASGGNDSAKTFTVYGTSYPNGYAITESIAGGSTATVYTTQDFYTVTRVAISAASAGTVKVGTNAIGSTLPIILDNWANPCRMSAAVVISGTETMSLEMSYDDLGPNYDIFNNTVTWFPVNGFTALTSNTNGIIEGPATMLRLTNTSGTGTATAKVIQPFIGGGF